MTVAFRSTYSLLGVLLTPYLRLDSGAIKSNALTNDLIQRSEGMRYCLLGVWERFDTVWYLHIAAQGYDRPETVVFYPLYPVLIRTITSVVGEPLAAALLVSTIASFFLFWGFQKLFMLDLQYDYVVRALVILFAWPASFIFFAGYPESLVIALSIWSIYFARTHRWWYAGVVGLLAGTAKAVGALVVVPLAVLAVRERNPRALSFALCLLGPLGYFVFLALLNLPLPSEAYPSYWSTVAAIPGSTLLDALRQLLVAPPSSAIKLATNLALLFGVIIPALCIRIRLEYTLFAAALLCAFLAKKSEALLQSTARYVVEIFPGFASLARLIGSLPGLLVFVPFSFGLNLFLLNKFFEWSLDV